MTFVGASTTGRVTPSAHTFAARSDTLDGLRALACLWVIGFHAHLPGCRFGFLGVQIFFALSGYLTTLQLARRPIDARRFIARRLRRLYPPLVLMVIVMTVVAIMMHPGQTLGLMILAVGALAWCGDLPKLAGLPVAFFGHLWTMAVEMRFYLVWPLVLPIILRLGGREPWALIGLAGLSCLFYVLPAPWGLTGAPAYIWRGESPAPFLLGAALALWPVPRVPILARALSWFPFPALGRLSYEAYLWGFPALWFVEGLPWPVRGALNIFLAFGLAWISRQVVECITSNLIKTESNV